jgi:hypothetical protein
MDLWHVQSCRDENSVLSVLAESVPMHRKRVRKSAPKPFRYGLCQTRHKRTFLVGMETEEGERVPEARAVKGLGS